MQKQRFAIIIAGSLGFLLGCVSDDRATHVLRSAGYTEIQIGGYAWLDCSEDDQLKSNFTAKGPTGERVDGAVCCGVMGKNCTIRLD